MARVHDLIEKVSDPALREALAVEIRKLEKNKKFGLVFEEHLPEAAPLPGVPVRVGMTVATREADGGALFIVKAIKDGVAEVRRITPISSDAPLTLRRERNVSEASDGSEFFNLEDLVAVAKFGEPIYPYLEKVDEIEHGGGDLWHALIQADNYHALQLLEYLYPGQVDCIYIDPPYNTGAKDWKYNNDYVDGNDGWRHSKWLSMMEHRLRIAKRLLNPRDSVLIVTIDEKEYLHLGMLLEQMFPEARIQMVSSVINPASVAHWGKFARTDEYLYFVMFGESSPLPLALSDDWRGNAKGGYKDQIRWNGLTRSGTEPLRKDRPASFYPIYVSDDGLKIVKVGDPIPLNVDRRTVPGIEGAKTIWPIRSNGEEGRWQLGAKRLKDAYAKGYIKLGKFTKTGMAISYLAEGEVKKVENGDFAIIGNRKDGSIIVDEDNYHAKFIPGSQWWINSHDATQLGTKLLSNIIGNRFTFPKSLYAVHDAIRFFVAEKPNSIIVDFFAGSGTTLHAVNLLNAEDGGKRRCILVTNNEISADETKEFRNRGLKPGNPEWEAKGIAQYVTWPRTTCSIRGVDVKGVPLKGEYITNGRDARCPSEARKMSDGFQANAVFFKLGFQDPTQVALGRQFKEILPTLWMKAGAHGKCPVAKAVKDMLILPENRMAILFDESAFAAFKKQVRAAKTIETVYIVTDYAPAYRSMARAFPGMKTYSLYRNYLDSFRINVSRS